VFLLRGRAPKYTRELDGVVTQQKEEKREGVNSFQGKAGRRPKKLNAAPEIPPGDAEGLEE